MLIALLAVIGVDVAVIVVLVAVLLARRLWVRRQPGAFKGAIRIVDGELPGLRRKWKRGFGRWVRDILVWTTAPSLFRNRLIAIDGLADEVRPGEPGEVKRLGSDPVIVPVTVDGPARIEVAARADSRTRVLGPFAAPGRGVRGTRQGPWQGRPEVMPADPAMELRPKGKHASPE